MNRRTSLSTVLSIVMLVTAAYAAVVLAAFAFQSRLVFFPNLPSRVLGPGPDSIGLDHESLEILTEDGVRLHAWYLPVPEPRGTVLFFHGNAGNISHRLDSLRIFHQLNLATLILDYRGIPSGSCGTATEVAARLLQVREAANGRSVEMHGVASSMRSCPADIKSAAAVVTLAGSMGPGGSP